MDRHILILALALLIDRLMGDPRWLWQHIPHPVVLFGKCIEWADYIGNRAGFCPATKRFNGFVTVFVLIVLAILAGIFITRVCHSFGLAGVIIEATVGALFLAQKSLADHVRAVFTALQTGGLKAGRGAVTMIVGRDPEMLDETGVCRAAIESLAENSSDGVVAPFFWFAILGLPGLLAYKMLNTADSMIGHKNARFAEFGFAAARTDDIANYIPARLTGLIAIVIVLMKQGKAAAYHTYGIMQRDAGYHRSPNAGWPESAYAGALDISLAGPRYYGKTLADEPYQNAVGRSPCANDIIAALKLFYQSMNLLLAVTFGIFLLEVVL